MDYSREQILGILAAQPEALASIGSSMATFPFALLAGGGAKVFRRALGEGEETAHPAAEDAFRRTMESGTYQPRTRAGQDLMSAIGKGLEASKIPPFVPGIGRFRIPTKDEAIVGGAKAAEPALRKMFFQEGTDIPRGALTAVKPAPGGHWTPLSTERIKAQLTAAEGPEGLDFVNTGGNPFNQWAERAAQRWLSKHAGTDRDPARALNLGTQADPVTLEQLVDKSLRKRRLEDIAQEDRPVMARAGEEVWNFNPRPQLAQFLSHAGDFARQMDPRDLERMDLPTLFRKVHESDRRQLVRTAKTGSAREEAMARILAEHPGGPMLTTQQGNKLLEFKQGMDPEAVKLGLSVDTCIGDHCIAGVKHGMPQFGYPGYVPARDIVTRQKVRPDFPETTRYIEDVLQGRGTAYSLRTPQGRPVATAMSQLRAPQGVARGDVRSKIMTPREYLKWQGTQRELEVPLEQRIRLPDGTAAVEGGDPLGGGPVRQRVHAAGGHVVPNRGVLGPEQVQSIIGMFPQYREKLEALAIRRRNELDQVKGRLNQGVPPEFAPDLVEMIGKIQPDTFSTMGKADLMRSGVGLSGKKPVTIQELMQIPEAARALPEVDANTMALVEAMLRQRGLTELTQEQTAALGEVVRHLMGR